MTLLPSIDNILEYRKIYRDPTTWLPAMQAICEILGYNPDLLSFGPAGSHVVFWVGSDRLIKLFCPLWKQDYEAEYTVLKKLTPYPDLLTPQLITKGQLESWPFIVISAVKGRPIEDVWDAIPDRDKTQIFNHLGQVIAKLHSIPTDNLEKIDKDWSAFIQHQMTTLLDR